MATQRISHEPAYVLHRYDWSESSLILETFTRHRVPGFSFGRWLVEMVDEDVYLEALFNDAA